MKMFLKVLGEAQLLCPHSFAGFLWLGSTSRLQPLLRCHGATPFTRSYLLFVEKHVKAQHSEG